MSFLVTLYSKHQFSFELGHQLSANLNCCWADASLTFPTNPFKVFLSFIRCSQYYLPPHFPRPTLHYAQLFTNRPFFSYQFQFDFLLIVHWTKISCCLIMTIMILLAFHTFISKASSFGYILFIFSVNSSHHVGIIQIINPTTKFGSIQTIKNIRTNFHPFYFCIHFSTLYQSLIFLESFV